ncbi:hypothetical protein LIA77_00985 [Sarocladium implicatum]|nr:hypothetical protein LIA77_00985 [Sarocladium implicatum]
MGSGRRVGSIDLEVRDSGPEGRAPRSDRRAPRWSRAGRPQPQQLPYQPLPSLPQNFSRGSLSSCRQFIHPPPPFIHPLLHHSITPSRTKLNEPQPCLSRARET